MAVAVINVRMVQVTSDEVIDMIAMRHVFMTAARPMLMIARVGLAVVLASCFPNNQ